MDWHWIDVRLELDWHRIGPFLTSERRRIGNGLARLKSNWGQIGDGLKLDSLWDGDELSERWHRIDIRLAQDLMN